MLLKYTSSELVGPALIKSGIYPVVVEECVTKCLFSYNTILLPLSCVISAEIEKTKKF